MAWTCFVTRILLLVGLLVSAAPGLGAQTITTAEVDQEYHLEATFDPARATISGELKVAWTNTTGEPQGTLPFRLYPNADHYGEAGIELSAVVVEGEAVLLDGDPDDPTVVGVPLGYPVLPGDARDIHIGFTTTIPIDSAGSFGIFRGNSNDGSWSLVNWYPIVAGWEPGTGWYLDSPPVGVDPTFVTASAWTVAINHPADLMIIATGEERTDSSSGWATTIIELETGRELAIVAYPVDEMAIEEKAVGKTRVTVSLTDADMIPGLHDTLLGIAAESMERYSSWLGAPLAGQLDLVSAQLDGALGVSWTGAIWLDLSQITADGQLDDAEREGLRFVVLHEIAHQWVANLIGTNSNNHTWLTEGLANVLAVAVVRDIDGPVAAERAFRGGVAGPYRAFVNGGQDAVADTPIGELDPLVHSLVTYGKGGVGFEAIRQEIGDEAFFSALASLAEHYAWGIAAPEDVLAAFEVASGQDLADLWAFWFFRADTALADVDAVIAVSGE
jgi:hypothetical protein